MVLSVRAVWRNLTRILTVFLTLGISFDVPAQTVISGVINQYAKVTYINAARDVVRVQSNVFAPGDQVLIIQMKGATINTTNTADYGNITSLNNAGIYEMTKVHSVNQDTVVLNTPLCHEYSPADSVQLVKVPVYRGNVEVTGTLTCTPWGAGGVGGILVMEVSDTLILNGDIDVSQNGFRGAQVLANGFLCDNNTFYTAVPSEGQKGEGIAHYVPFQEYGRGKLANGGGGSSAANSGAGGGGNYGAGGKGGNQYSGCISTGDYSAFGGMALPAAVDRIFMGGGGGGPQRDNGQSVYPGGNGGGIILLKARVIRGNNKFIRADGQSVINNVADEGTSGGGAGGSIYVLCSQYDGAVQMSASGGAGGSTNNIAFATACHGPAGGGGGGVIWLSTASLPASVSAVAAGGNAGMVLNPQSPCYNTTHESRPGDPGAVLFNLPDGLIATLGLRDTAICTPTTSLTLDIGSGYSNIVWYNGATTPSVTVPGVGTYYVRATTSLGCTVYDTARVYLDTMTLGRDTVICMEASLTLTPFPRSGRFVSYEWQDGSVDSNFVVTAPGSYYVTVVTQGGCTLSDTILVSVDSLPKLRDTVLCENKFNLTISLPAGYRSYQWSTGSTASSISVDQPGTYTVSAVTDQGCSLLDTMLVIVDSMSLGADTVFCGDMNYTLVPQPAGNFVSYLWQDRSTNPDLTVTQAGTYHVIVQTIYNCTLHDTVILAVDSLPRLTLEVLDSALCAGSKISLAANYTRDGLDSLTWRFGDGLPFIAKRDTVDYLFDQSGSYAVQIYGWYRACPDDSALATLDIRPYPVLNIGEDTAICPGGEPIVLGDFINLAAGRWLWSNGATENSITVTEPGNYYATVTVDGCSTTDSVLVRRSCFIEIPNVFTPNGDGNNDYFFPKSLLTRAIVSFKMQVYNRWGQILFETTRADGRGWDGRFNDEIQPQGVYVYLIEVSFANGVTERYQGNVTLLR